MASKEQLAAKQRAYRAANPDRVRETKRRQYFKKREEIIKKASEYVARNPEKTRERIAAWRERNREANAARDKAYRQRNSERYAMNVSRYYEENKERLAAYNAAYFKANPGRRKAKFENRRARLSLAEGRHTAEDIVSLGMAQKWHCACCGIDITQSSHVDHIVPLKLGGSNWKENLQLLCKTCNLLKGAMHPIEFKLKAARLGLIRSETHHG